MCVLFTLVPSITVPSGSGALFHCADPLQTITNVFFLNEHHCHHQVLPVSTLIDAHHHHKKRDENEAAATAAAASIPL